MSDEVRLQMQMVLRQALVLRCSCPSGRRVGPAARVSTPAGVPRCRHGPPATLTLQHNGAGPGDGPNADWKLGTAAPTRGRCALTPLSFELTLSPGTERLPASPQAQHGLRTTGASALLLRASPELSSPTLLALRGDGGALNYRADTCGAADQITCAQSL